ncbi:Msr family ABC-F type ribosomal protection protein [Alkalicoccobacillus murimartini]|uniref:Macrolide transport system ATP-binding/permease protein n=1 Tax=Alkalicoccobacillus murimartini TaxID=171685 RepID=A0ABT9YKK2_9BACI|nr:ABC-F type ribosomal protection protein [Alkalicoccobacillus murimartini]MDQ0208399.1 macrolide transport system ATP-binding/permease protein [Alkalicoccobacillus murimartini]
MEQLNLELSNVEVTFLDQKVLDLQSLSIYQFDRIGIVGKNGSGKSTLLNVLQGGLNPTSGNVQRFVDFGYFEQTTKPDHHVDDYELLARLSIPDSEVDSLSGGEQTRLKLASLFSHYYEGLLIDEPTTHLDAEGTHFLLEQLRYYYGSLVLISHDRYVLDQLVTKIWEVADGRVTEYVGNYTDYEKQKQLESKQQKETYEKYQKDKQRLLSAAEEKMKKAEKITQANSSMSKKETKAKANRMFMTKSKDTSQKLMQRAAKAIEKRVEQLDDVPAPEVIKQIRFYQSPTLKLHNKFPIMADQLTVTAGEKTLLTDVRFQFPLGRTIAIQGANGSGKSSLIKHITEQKESITLSPKVIFGIYTQHAYHFTEPQTVMAFMKSKSDYDESKIRSILHAMDLSGNDLKKNVQDLSGGEAIRLVLCELFLGNYNVLVLDEPTNFLDISCLEALESFLSAYQGTVLLVSHDRRFVDRVADHVFEISKQTLIQMK